MCSEYHGRTALRVMIVLLTVTLLLIAGCATRIRRSESLSLRRWRSLRFFLSSLARFHFDVARGHCVGDMDFIANFDVTRDFGVRVAINLPTVFPLLHHDHRIIHF